MRGRKEEQNKPKNKYLMTEISSIDIRNVMQQYGYEGEDTVFRVFCKCADVSDANRECKLAGFNRTVFSRVETEDVEDENEKRLAESGGIWLTVDGKSNRLGYLSWEVVRKQIYKAKKA